MNAQNKLKYNDDIYIYNSKEKKGSKSGCEGGD